MPRLRVAFLLAAVAACGGKVAVDNAPASAGGAGGTTSSGTANTTAVSSSGGGNAGCAEACAALAAKGCGGPGCVAACQQGLAASPSCNDDATGLLTCIRDHAAAAVSCFVDACSALRGQLQACATTFTCMQPVLSANDSDTACVGKGICSSGEVAADCDVSGNCSCLLGTGDVFSCLEQGPFLCDFVDGCCAVKFAGGG